MKYTLNNGYQTSRVVNGCWQLSAGHSLENNLDLADVKQAFYQLTDMGLNTFDCADIYTGVEEFIGAFIKESKRDVQVHTKYVPDLNELSNISFASTEAIIDRSLKRLNKDCLELVQFHWWDYEIPGSLETASHLVELQKKGKIQNIGGTNFDTVHLKELVDNGIPMVSVQAQYSMFDRRCEKSLQTYCQEQGISMFCYGTLSGGFTSERWIGKTLDTMETRSQVKYIQVIEDTMGWDNYQKLLLLLKEIGDRHQVSLSNVATKYILSQPAVAGAIVGVRSSKHVASNAQIFDFQLDDNELKTISQFIGQFPQIDGEPFELERTIGSKYRNIMKMNINEEEQN